MSDMLFGFDLPNASLTKDAENLLASIIMLPKIYCGRCVATSCNRLRSTFM